MHHRQARAAPGDELLAGRPRGARRRSRATPQSPDQPAVVARVHAVTGRWRRRRGGAAARRRGRAAPVLGFPQGEVEPQPALDENRVCRSLLVEVRRQVLPRARGKGRAVFADGGRGAHRHIVAERPAAARRPFDRWSATAAAVGPCNPGVVVTGFPPDGPPGSDAPRTLGPVGWRRGGRANAEGARRHAGFQNACGRVSSNSTPPAPCGRRWRGPEPAPRRQPGRRRRSDGGGVPGRSRPCGWPRPPPRRPCPAGSSSRTSRRA